MFAKVFASLWDGTMATDWHLWSLWVFMLANKNADGVVDMTHEAISRKSGIPVEIVYEGIAKLEAPDPRSRSRDLEGRRILRLDTHRDWGWEIVNAQQYAEKSDPETRRAQFRSASSKRRAMVSAQAAASTASTGVNSGQQPSTHVDVDTDADILLASSLRSESCGALPGGSTGTASTGTAPDGSLASAGGPAGPPDPQTLDLTPPGPRKGHRADLHRFGPGALEPAWVAMADENGIGLPTNRDGDWYAGAALLLNWQRAYPAVDVIAEMRRMRAWMLSNRANRKTTQGMARSVNGWLGREQDKGGRSAGGPPRRGQRAGADTDYLSRNNIGAGQR